MRSPACASISSATASRAVTTWSSTSDTSRTTWLPCYTDVEPASAEHALHRRRQRRRPRRDHVPPGGARRGAGAALAYRAQVPHHDLARGALARRSYFFQAEDGIRDYKVTGVQTCALP